MSVSIIVAVAVVVVVDFYILCLSSCVVPRLVLTVFAASDDASSNNGCKASLIASSLGSARQSLSGPQVLRRHQGGLTVVLGKHVLALFALAMSAISYNWETHGLVCRIISNQLLESNWQILELLLVGETGLEELRLQLYLILIVLQW